MAKRGTVVLKKVPTRGLRRYKCPDVGHNLCVGKVDGSFPAVIVGESIGQKQQNIGVILWKNNNTFHSIANENSTLAITTDDKEINFNNSAVFMFNDFEYRYVSQIMAGILLLFYIMVLFTVARNMKKLHNSFYMFVLSLGLVDTSCLLINAVEVRFLKEVNIEPNIWVYTFIVQFLWYCNIFNVSGLTITRFMVIVWHRKGEKFLTTRNLTIGLALIWLSALALALPMLFPSQRYALVDKEGLVYYWDLSPTYFLVENVISIFCITFSMLLYFLMFVKAKIVRGNVATTSARSTTNRRRSSNVIDKEEYKILLQSFILASCMTLCLLNDYIFYITSDIMINYGFTKFTVLLNYGINPFLYIIFSSQIRDLIFCLRPSIKNFSSIRSDTVMNGNFNKQQQNSTRQRLMSQESEYGTPEKLADSKQMNIECS